MTELETIRRCMELMPASVCTYEQWLHVGMVLYDLLGEAGCPEWDNWSMSDSRYREGECYAKMKGFGRSHEKVAVGTIVKYVQDHGLWESVPHQQVSEDRTFDYDDALPDYSAPADTRVVRSEYIVPATIRDPGDGWDQVGDMIDYLSAVFKPEDRVSFCVKALEFARKDGGKSWRPVNAGNAAHTAGELTAELQRLHDRGERKDVGAVIMDYNREAGVWIRVNAVLSSDGSDASVASYANTLVECDSKSPEEQLAIIRKLNLPCAAIVHSGGKSVHAIVRVGASTEREYQQRVDRLFKECEKAGLPLDRQNRNPSRYTRLAGVLRGSGRQFLIDVNCGAPSWDEWVDWLDEQTDDLPDMVSAAEFISNPPPLTEELIQGILRKGHKMLVSGPSKAGKSYLLLELAIAIANGTDWLGFKCSKGKCVYINLEVQKESDQNRIANLWRILNMPLENARNLEAWDLRGYSRSLEKMVPAIVRRVKNMASVSAIILDPIYKVITGDENRAEEMGKFCNFFDQLAEKCKCSMIYCHHHSKGSQGDKKAQDRASGSGVFARDPDALLDMIELVVDDNRRKAVSDRMVCDALGRLMDEYSTIWRDVTPQDEQLKASVMAELASKTCGEDETAAVVAEIRGKMSTATAWRFDGILREFPPLPSVNAWFLWPLHVVDNSGILADVLVDGQQKTGPSKKDRLDSAIAEMSLVFDDLSAQGEVAVADVMARMNKTQKEIYDLARKSKVFKINKGIIRRKDED